MFDNLPVNALQTAPVIFYVFKLLEATEHFQSVLLILCAFVEFIFKACCTSILGPIT